MSTLRNGWAVVGACGVLTAGALAQDKAPGQEGAPKSEPAGTAAPAAEDAPKFWQRDDRWTVRFEPGAWYTGLSGDLKLPRASEDAGGNASTDIGRLNQDSRSRFTPFGEVNLRRGDWGVSVRGFSYSADENAPGWDGRIGDLPIEAGDDVGSSVEIAGFDVEARYTFLPWKDKRVLPGPARVRPRVDGVAGLRVYDTSWSVINRSVVVPSGSTANVAAADEFFVQPALGVKASIEMYDEFTLDAQLVVGGMPFGDTSYTMDLLVGGAWKPQPNFGVQVGYRALFLGLSSGNDDAAFEFTGALQGLYVSAVLEF